ncbi:unnamed protein product [Allacma fusca]|uniref:Uncharacterized protein n=1 Tax=Allacma fusca TaxID=39272 RepID=A0A8J2PK10_9HEXA|nr:unnamed protein product [Allacma fusca]
MIPVGKMHLSLLCTTLLVLSVELMVFTSVEAEKVIIKGAKANIDLPDQTISEVLIKRIRPSNRSSEVLLHKIIITRDPNQNGSLIKIPMPIKQGQPVFINNSSFEVDFDNYVDNNDTKDNKSSISGRGALGLLRANQGTDGEKGRSALPVFGRGVAKPDSQAKGSGEVECDDYGDIPESVKPPGKNCWSREEFDDKMARIRNTVTKNLNPCPETLPCRQWSSCLYLWPTGLVTEKLAINPEGERKYFSLLLDGIEESVKKEIRDFMNECYKIYGLHQPFGGEKKRKKRNAGNRPEIDIGLSNCRARILDIQECLGYGVWKALCQEEM